MGSRNFDNMYIGTQYLLPEMISARKRSVNESQICIFWAKKGGTFIFTKKFWYCLMTEGVEDSYSFLRFARLCKSLIISNFKLRAEHTTLNLIIIFKSEGQCSSRQV